MVGKYVVVRCDRAGVFAGVLKSQKKQKVVLTDCRRLWYWEGACSISQLAVDGTKKPENCKFTVTVNEIMLLDTIEVIPCTSEAEESIKRVKVWKI